MSRKAKENSDKLESYWLPKFEQSAQESDDAARNIGRSFGHEERRIVFEELLNQYLPNSASSVLDVGCGTGTYFDLYEKYGLLINGADYSQAQIGVARDRFPKAKLYACLLEDVPETTVTDLVVSIGVTQVVSDLDSLLKHAAQRLSSEGIAVISCLNKGSIWPGGITDPHLRFFTLNEIRGYLSKYFEEITFRRFYPMPGPFIVMRAMLYKMQIPLLNHGFMFVLKKK
ncbi:class I SAM-dependent methyltransferase [Puniceicoccaceae bacterium K14]|nr:class I SAM-dependent methyltransferase [Puniceicoccaceae bacterium K14]